MDPLPDLPVSGALPALSAALAAATNALLVAPPGAGKTTLVPLSLLEADWRGEGRILVLEPRRLAARAAASRMAALRGEAVGQTVGYRTRIEAAVSAATRIEVITEGLLTRRLLADPGLEGVAAVILDEVHERSVEGDLALALCLDLQRLLRPELRLIAMSATTETDRLAALMGAAVIESAGRAFPVTIRHSARDIVNRRDLPEAAATAVRAALGAHEGDILVFLPGMAEIRRTASLLEGCRALVLALHGELAASEQDLALRPAPGRRVVLASSIAETSLTVPGVRIVIDGGFRRAPRLDGASGLPRLASLRISRAAAQQRAGRAGREGPGVAIRLWTEALHRGLPAHDKPEILDAELAALLLDCTLWGTPPGALAFLDAPPQAALAAARALLTALGALDEAGAITTLGRRMATLGAHPRLAAMMLAATEPDEAALAADIAALLEERDPLRAGPEPPADIGLRLAAIASGDRTADQAALGRIRRAAARYRRRLGLPANAPAGGDAGRLLAAGFPDRIGQSRGERGAFRLAGGGGARMARTDRLAGPPLLAIAALEMKQAARIRLAAPLEPDALPRALAAQIATSVELAYDAERGMVIARRRARLGALVLSDRTEPADPAEAAAALAAVIAADPAKLPWTDEARQFQARVGLMRGLEPGLWPDLSDAALGAQAMAWLGPYLHGLTRLADLGRLDLSAMLRAMLSHDLATRLDRELPRHLALAGGRAAVDYTEPVPIARARAQAFYGMAETPLLAGGRVPLRLALLSPAGRPAAITADLAGFWASAWPEVRKDMRGRYPKHDWPENGARP